MQNKIKTKDMTKGPILKAMILFALPLLLGNIFQLLYNTVDTLVVGNFVGKTALAAVGSTTSIINILVFFFNGLSIGASVVIGQNFGAKKEEDLHKSVQTTMAMTFALSVLFSIIGILTVNLMLRMMSTPEDVMESAGLYLRIYFAGIAGLLIYNMGSGILRAVGDTVRPLIFLIVTSVLNIILDLLFVLVFQMGIAGVAYATVISQFISCVMIIYLLSTTKDIYRMSWVGLKVDWKTMRRILKIGLPTAIQSTITSFSNVFVLGYVNTFGSASMAGWSCFTKLEQFMFLPMGSMSNAATSFVSQNVGAGDYKRVRSGTRSAIIMILLIVGTLSLFMNTFAEVAIGFFTKEEDVIAYGVMYLREAVFFLLFNCINHVLAGSLRGRGDSTGPTIIMLTSFVALRQVYLYAATHLIANTPQIVGYGFPVGWTACCIIEVIYYFARYGKQK